MPEVWIESMHNLHCPTCDDRLIERAGRYDVLVEVVGDPTTPKYVADGGTAPVCRAGHEQPADRDALYAYRDKRGYPQSAPFQEVPAPR